MRTSLSRRALPTASLLALACSALAAEPVAPPQWFLDDIKAQTADGGRVPVATTAMFAFHSDFATNLNDALVSAGAARNAHEPELFHSGEAVSCFDELPGSARAGWNRAVDYYAEVISPAGIFDRQQYLLRLDLAGFDERLGDARARRFAGIARGLRQAAAPAYAACRWPEQDAENRRWIDRVVAQLAVHEESIARQLGALYQQEWSALPITVDIVETVNWSGANSTFPPGTGGHLLVSTAYQDEAALEIVFHEASHGLMLRNAPVPQALEAAAAANALELPDDLWHVVLFFTTGETVRRVLAEDGGSEYRPVIYDIFDRGGAWTAFREPLESTWPGYVDGKLTLAEAAAELLRSLDEPRK